MDEMRVSRRELVHRTRCGRKGQMQEDSTWRTPLHQFFENDYVGNRI